MIPWNSPINPRGNLGDVDGSPAGLWLKKNSQPTAFIEWEEMEFTELNLKLYKDIGLCLTALVISSV